MGKEYEANSEAERLEYTRVGRRYRAHEGMVASINLGTETGWFSAPFISRETGTNPPKLSSYTMNELPMSMPVTVPMLTSIP